MLAVIGVTLIMAQVCSAKKHDKDVLAPPKPAQRVSLEELGMRGTPTPGLLRTGAAIATLDFIDNMHVLLTFVENPLTKRTEPAPDDVVVPASAMRARQDRTVKAQVIDLASGKPVKQAEWRVHDRDAYLFAIGGGKFLLRQGGRLSLVGADLERRRLGDSEQAIIFADARPASGLLLVEMEHEQHTPEEHAKLVHDSALFDVAPPVEEADVYAWHLPLEDPPKKVLFHTLLPKAGVLVGNGDGVVELSRAGTDKFEAYFHPISGDKRRFLYKLKSECRPAANMLRSNVVLFTGCKGGGDENYAVNLDGEFLWRAPAELGALPVFVSSEDGRRFVEQSTGTIRQPLSSSPDEDDFARGTAQVLDVDTGARCFATTMEPLYGPSHTVAISADGMRLAMLRKGALEIYDLPPLADAPMPERKK